MKRQMMLSAAIAGVLAMATVGVAIAQGRQPAQTGGSDVIHLVLPATGAHVQFLDFDHNGLGFADRLLTVGPIMNEAQSERVGTAYLDCWIGSKGYQDGSPLVCTQVLKLADGNITTHGVDPHGLSDVFFSVTGGTGAYSGASGQAEYIDTAQTDIIIDLDD